MIAAPLLLSLGVLLLGVSAFLFLLSFLGWLIERSPLRRWADLVARIISGGGPWKI